MNYKSKYTASEIDARLSQVFDSTLQTKEVEVSADTTIKADEGFLGLKEVNVKVSGGGGSASAWRYFDVSKLDNSMKPMVLPFIAKTNNSITPIQTALDWSTVSAVGVDNSPKFMFGGVIMTWSEMMAAEGLTPEVMAQVGIVEITEEAFYAL